MNFLGDYDKIAKIISGGGFTYSINNYDKNGETLLTLAAKKGDFFL